MRKLLFVLGVLGVFCSCSSDEPSVLSQEVEITFTTDDNGWKNAGSVTRGTLINSPSDIASFGVSASVYPAANSYTTAGCGSYWFNREVSTLSGCTGYYWPGSDYRLSFYAYYPYGNAALTVQSTKNTVGMPTYSYTVPSAIGSQLDVMTANHTDLAGNTNSQYGLSFKHDCSVIAFILNNLRTEAVTVKSVAIEGVKYSGTLNNHSWTLSSAVNSSSSNPFVLTLNRSVAATTNNVDLTGSSNLFIMLPQELPAGTKLILKVDDDTYEVPITGSWQRGKRMTYVLNLQRHLQVFLSVTDWTENGIYGNFTANGWDEEEKGVIPGVTINNWTTD